MNKTRPLPFGAGPVAAVSVGGDDCSFDSLSFASSVFTSDDLPSVDSDSATGTDEVATLRTPPCVAWKVFLGVEDTVAAAVVVEGGGGGVGYE